MNTWRRILEEEMEELKLTWKEMKKAQDDVVWRGIVGGL